MILLLSPSDDDDGDGGGPALDLPPIKRIMHTVSISLFFVPFKRVSDMYVLAAVERGAPVRVGAPSPPSVHTSHGCVVVASFIALYYSGGAARAAAATKPATKIGEKPCPLVRPSVVVRHLYGGAEQCGAEQTMRRSRGRGRRRREGVARSVLVSCCGLRGGGSPLLSPSRSFLLVSGFAWLVRAPRRSLHFVSDLFAFSLESTVKFAQRSRQETAEVGVRLAVHGYSIDSPFLCASCLVGCTDGSPDADAYVVVA